MLAKQLGIIFDGQEAHKKLVCADADESPYAQVPIFPPISEQDAKTWHRWPKHNLALCKHASLLKLWQKINRAQIGRQTGSKYFYTFSTYSWSWNSSW
ncbi:UNVERIFIED_CONTAM: hypothetical protein H355_004008 [Colinus virginianus]|nr:hypothetical protein H355_004008 [Colinus virginianus]